MGMGGRSIRKTFTLCVCLKVPGQLHGEDGVEESGDESSIQAAHRPKHLEQQQPQRHAVLLRGDTMVRVSRKMSKMFDF